MGSSNNGKSSAKTGNSAGIGNYGFRDYQLTIDGTIVAVGDKEFLAGVLGLKPSSLWRWIRDEKHREWGSIDTFPNAWRIGGVDYTTEEACALLKCSPEQLSRYAFSGRYDVHRIRISNWSLPQDAIDFLLKSHR